jgi:hypothetical protein
MIVLKPKGAPVEAFMRLLSKVANQVNLVASDDKDVSYHLRLAGWDDNDGTVKPTIIFTVQSEDRHAERHRKKAPSLVKAVARSIRSVN